MFGRGTVQRTMRTYGVVVDAPRFDERPCFGDAGKPVFVEAFVAKLALKLSTTAFSIGFAEYRLTKPVIVVTLQKCRTLTSQISRLGLAAQQLQELLP